MLKWLCLVLVTRVAARLNESCTGFSSRLGTYDGLRCDSGQCVIDWFVCDGDNDCGDHSDEEDCSISDGLEAMSGVCRAPKAGFGHGARCPSGECIQRRLMCDGNKDCLDGSDEKCTPYNSSRVVTGLSGRVCESILGQGRSCGLNGRCLPVHWFCDGERDCPGGEDEEFCAGASCRSLLGPGIRCGIRCVPRMFFCDGDKDCFDGRDEANCSNSSRPTSYTEYEALEVTTSPYTLPTTNPTITTNPTTTTIPTTTTTTTRAPRPSKSTISHSKLDSEFSDRGHLLQPASAIHHDSSTSNSSKPHIFSFLIPFLLILQTSHIFNH